MFNEPPTRTLESQMMDFEKLWQESRLSNSAAEIYKADIEDLVRVAVERAIERNDLSHSISEQNNAGRYGD
jgi:hypothetical protein